MSLHPVEDAAPEPAAEVAAPAPAVAPATARRRPVLLMLVGTLAAGNIVASALRVVGGLLTARLADPAMIGLFNGLALILSYAQILQFGIINGMNRELPYHIGAGDKERAHDLAASAQGWALLVAGVVTVAFLVAGVWFGLRRQPLYAVGMLVQAASAPQAFYAQMYLTMTYRTGGDFAKLAGFNVVFAAANLAMTGLIALFGYYGLSGRAILLSVLQIALLHVFRPIRRRPRLNVLDLKHLLRIGAPIYVVGQVYQGWTLLESTLVLAMAGQVGLGAYSLVVMASTMLQLVPDSASQVLYPRMAQEYGQTHSVRRIAMPYILPLLGLTLAASPFAFGWSLLAPHFVTTVLPKYSASSDALRWALWIPTALCMLPLINVFNVVKRQDLFLVALAMGIGVYVAALYGLHAGATHLSAFTQAMVLGRAAFIAVVLVLVLRLVRAEDRARAVTAG